MVPRSDTKSSENFTETMGTKATEVKNRWKWGEEGSTDTKTTKKPGLAHYANNKDKIVEQPMQAKPVGKKIKSKTIGEWMFK